MSPTIPLLASTGLTLAAGFANEGRWPAYGTRSVAAFGVLLIVFAFLSGTRARPVVSAFSWLILLGVVYATAPSLASGRRNDPQSGDTRPVGRNRIPSRYR